MEVARVSVSNTLERCICNQILWQSQI